jgi:hypothetical protein
MSVATIMFGVLLVRLLQSPFWLLRNDNYIIILPALRAECNGGTQSVVEEVTIMFGGCLVRLRRPPASQ